MSSLAVVLIWGVVLGAILLSWGYFRRYAVSRPPIGVFNLRDITFMIGMIVLVPYLYLALPGMIVGGLLTLATGSVIYMVAEPLLSSGAARWAVTLALLGTDLGTHWFLGPGSAIYLAVNNMVILVMVVGITNLWAQSGMKARDVTILGVVLIAYDFMATTLLPLMGQMMAKLATLPFSPQVAWPGDTGLVLIGLGDLLLAAVFPLVLHRAFGCQAGRVALGLALAALTGLFMLPLAGFFPVMVVLGPLMLTQYAYWRRRAGTERRTWEYLQAEAT